MKVYVLMPDPWHEDPAIGGIYATFELAAASVVKVGHAPKKAQIKWVEVEHTDGQRWWSARHTDAYIGEFELEGVGE